MWYEDAVRRAREGIEWLRAIGVSTVPRGPKGRRTATGMPTSGSRHPKTGNPAPFQIFARHPYMLMNLGQRDEPPLRRHSSMSYFLKGPTSASSTEISPEKLISFES